MLAGEFLISMLVCRKMKHYTATTQTGAIMIFGSGMKIMTTMETMITEMTTMEMMITEMTTMETMITETMTTMTTMETTMMMIITMNTSNLMLTHMISLIHLKEILIQEL